MQILIIGLGKVLHCVWFLTFIQVLKYLWFLYVLWVAGVFASLEEFIKGVFVTVDPFQIII